MRAAGGSDSMPVGLDRNEHIGRAFALRDGGNRPAHRPVRSASPCRLWTARSILLFEQGPLQLLGEQPLPADLTQRAGFHVALRRDRHQFDRDAALCQPGRDPFRLPAGQGAGASAEAKLLD